MEHKLRLNNATSVLIHNILHIPDTFKTPSDLMRAGELVGQLEAPKKTEDGDEWLDANPREITIHEKSRDLLKRAVETHANKLPPNKFTLDILKQLGFE